MAAFVTHPFSCAVRAMTGFYTVADGLPKGWKTEKDPTNSVWSGAILAVLSPAQVEIKDMLVKEGWVVAAEFPPTHHQERGNCFLMLYHPQVKVQPTAVKKVGVVKRVLKRGTVVANRRVKAESYLETILVLAGLMVWGGVTSSVAYFLVLYLGVI